MDAIELLQNDHDAVRSLFQSVDNAGDAVASRRELFAQIADALRIHSRIEEELFYPRVQRLNGDEEGEDLVGEALKEHGEVDELLAEIEGLDPSSRAWTRRVKKLRRRVDHHATEEEAEMFEFVRTRIPREELQSLGEAMRARKDALSPRSPHAVVPS